MSMTKFRQQRGGFEESMYTTEPCQSMESLLRIINRLGYRGEVVVKDYAGDSRNGWYTCLVTVNGHAIGFTDGMP
jgi:hypothetical protein